MDAWERIDRWLKANAPRIYKGLQGPASDDDIRAVEAALSLRLPSEMIESYRIHNGQGGIADPLVGDWKVLPLKHVASQWQIQKKLLDQGAFSGAVARPVGPVCAVWWSDKWIPFAHDGAGTLQCLDLDPAPGGIAGQVVVYWHDRELRERTADGIGGWLAQLANDLEAGIYAARDGQIVKTVTGMKADKKKSKR